MLELNTPSPALLAAIDSERLRLRELLAGRDETKLATRPPNGSWSVLENLQHLLFAGQGLGRYTPHGVQLSPLGLANDGLMRKFPVLGTVQPTISAEVFAAWDDSHRLVAQLDSLDTPPVRTALAKNLRHLRNHLAVIERQLRRSGA